MKFQILALCLFSWVTVGCSNQWRDADPGITADEMMSMLGEISTAQSNGTSSGDLTSALAMKDQPGVRIYFSQSKNTKDAKGNFIDPMGPVASILSLTNFDFLGLPGVFWNMIQEARIFFFDLPGEGGRTNALIIGTRQSNETALNYVGFTGSGSMGEADLVVTLQSSGMDKLVLRSYDVDGDDL